MQDSVNNPQFFRLFAESRKRSGTVPVSAGNYAGASTASRTVRAWTADQAARQIRPAGIQDRGWGFRRSGRGAESWLGLRALLRALERIPARTVFSSPGDFFGNNARTERWDKTPVRAVQGSAESFFIWHTPPAFDTPFLSRLTADPVLRFDREGLLWET